MVATRILSENQFSQTFTELFVLMVIRGSKVSVSSLSLRALLAGNSFSLKYFRALRADVPYFWDLLREIVERKDPQKTQSARRVLGQIWFLDIMETISGFSGKSYVKIVQKKIPEIVKMVSMVPGSLPEFFRLILHHQTIPGILRS